MQFFLSKTPKLLTSALPNTFSWPNTKCAFFLPNHFQGNSPLVDLKVLLPTREVLTVRAKRNSTCLEVFRTVAAEVGLRRESAEFFALYEIVEHNFGEF